jgi:hypothetical protein
MPDAQLPGGRLFDQLRSGHFLLLSEPGLTLIRPDGYIAWMGQNRAEAEAYLANLGLKEKAAP